MWSIGSLFTTAFRRYRQELAGRRPHASAPRVARVVYVGAPEAFTVVDEVLEAGSYELLFMTTIDTAYSDIVRAQPDRVVLCLCADDEDALRLLAMLNLDHRTRRIEVTTCVATVCGDPEPLSDYEGQKYFATSSKSIVMH